MGEAHARGYRVRFWGTPNLPAFWEALLGAGVDVVGVDDLELGASVLGVPRLGVSRGNGGI